jgi:hypothetical protein
MDTYDPERAELEVYCTLADRSFQVKRAGNASCTTACVHANYDQLEGR